MISVRHQRGKLCREETVTFACTVHAWRGQSVLSNQHLDVIFHQPQQTELLQGSQLPSRLL